ncbi:zinc ribbon domain-containing protein [Periweissella cryptocerci]|uniref:Zinc ribbon domain-containing protein n=1 Tax=Periweissella cryptocerci TaxID=2506420 RepID=A0A4P6YUY8_9LACO|nr:zinc ribbon domain-containing protein [Periweissella cryptocerci]QBO36614.1 zinc ribbon domain-containing protein [Periweissella cryptocerci]
MFGMYEQMDEQFIANRKVKLGYSGDTSRMVLADPRSENEGIGSAVGGYFYAIAKSMGRSRYVISFEENGLLFMEITNTKHEFTGKDTFVPKNEIGAISFDQALLTNGGLALNTKAMTIMQNGENHIFTIYTYLAGGNFKWLKADMPTILQIAPNYGGAQMAANMNSVKTTAVQEETSQSDSPHAKFCGNCGNSLNGGVFCSQCGTKAS